jgi:hypothetical protein
MDELAKIITDKWKTIIESTVVNGYSRKVESVDLFRMNKYYAGYPEIEFCYKVTFNFEDGISNSIYSNTTNPYIDNDKEKWHKRLEDRFINMFWDPSDEVMPRAGSNSGVGPYYYFWWELKLENSRVDYMTNQGYRFIIQFYPQGFVSELRNEKLEILGI